MQICGYRECRSVGTRDAELWVQGIQSCGCQGVQSSRYQGVQSCGYWGCRSTGTGNAELWVPGMQSYGYQGMQSCGMGGTAVRSVSQCHPPSTPAVAQRPCLLGTLVPCSGLSTHPRSLLSRRWVVCVLVCCLRGDL